MLLLGTLQSCCTILYNAAVQNPRMLLYVHCVYTCLWLGGGRQSRGAAPAAGAQGLPLYPGHRVPGLRLPPDSPLRQAGQAGCFSAWPAGRQDRRSLHLSGRPAAESTDWDRSQCKRSGRLRHYSTSTYCKKISGPRGGRWEGDKFVCCKAAHDYLFSNFGLDGRDMRSWPLFRSNFQTKYGTPTLQIPRLKCTVH